MSDVNEIVVTVIGRDRPGAVADVSGVLAELGLNLTDSSMTLLRGHFAMTLVCAGSASVAAVAAALAPLAADGLVTTVGVPPTAGADAAVGSPYTVVVHGGDRLGIVAAVTAALAAAGANITDLSTRLVGDLYVLTAEVDLPPGADLAALEQELDAVADRLSVAIVLRPNEADVL